VVARGKETSERYAVIVNTLWTIGRRIPTNDLWIVASAMQLGLTILTTDSDFTHIDQVLIHHIALT
jgi:predicted nucleic acid-binding protein